MQGISNACTWHSGVATTGVRVGVRVRVSPSLCPTSYVDEHVRECQADGTPRGPSPVYQSRVFQSSVRSFVEFDNACMCVGSSIISV